MRIILVALLLYSLTGFVTVSRELRQSELMAAQMRQQTEELRLLNGELEEKIAQGHSRRKCSSWPGTVWAWCCPGKNCFIFQQTERDKQWNWRWDRCWKAP